MLKKLDFISPRLRKWRKSWNTDLHSPYAKFSAYFDMLIFDHGIFRLLYANRCAIDTGVERSNHPTPGQVKAAAQRGVKTIVNLRGANDFGSYILEQEACRKYRVELVDFRIFSRDLPRKETIFRARELFACVEYPILMHCKSGADRAGLMSVLYLLVHKQEPVERALAQLSLKYGHVRQAKTGILDFFFESYRDFDRRTPTPFLEWVDKYYDYETLRKEFRSNRWANALVDKVLGRE